MNSHKFKIYEILFGGRGWGATSPKRGMKKKHVPKHSTRRYLEDGVENTAGDTLLQCFYRMTLMQHCTEHRIPICRAYSKVHKRSNKTK
jgi:hypothetical protein